LITDPMMRCCPMVAEQFNIGQIEMNIKILIEVLIDNDTTPPAQGSTILYVIGFRQRTTITYEVLGNCLVPWMRFQPFGSQQKTSIANNSITGRKAIEHRVKAVAFWSKLNCTEGKLVRICRW
jgi:hypothetical protein